MEALLLRRTDEIIPAAAIRVTVAVAIGRRLLLRFTATLPTTPEAQNEEEGTETDEEHQAS